VLGVLCVFAPPAAFIIIINNEGSVPAEVQHVALVLTQRVLKNRLDNGRRVSGEGATGVLCVCARARAFLRFCVSARGRYWKLG
jgi:hypothetical protein